ncbi:hypothetical protein FPOAC1_012621 [Fusarium poae]|uniref:hypothetical protein n=1 Tax=Fusarium poae TaxID=36050 RepID=UPI001CE88845|nr:hypothetical protein FPOAC1_012621 [Fusarium poae]KAG8667782.1 hypothetical protein FPOAC1_012621 [Fusarium poae]
MRNRLATYTPVGATDHQLPPTYELFSPGVVSVFVEYCVVAKLIFGGLGQVEMAEAIHPFRLVHYSPNPPIEDFALRVCRYPRTSKGTRLIPGSREGRTSLFGWDRTSMSRLGDPTFAYELLFGFPTRIQLDNPTPIQISLMVFPNWEMTSNILENVPQQFKLLSIQVLLVTCTKVRAFQREKCYTRSVDLDLSNDLDRLQREVLIPCANRWDPIDVGEMVDLRVGLKECNGEQFTPSFRTYNMTVTHKLQWKVQVQVVGETFSVVGEKRALTEVQ